MSHSISTHRAYFKQLTTGAAERARKLLDSIKEQRGWSMEDMYKLTLRDIRSCGGVVIASEFGYSQSAIIKAAYPEHNWLGWKFNKVHSSWWKKPENQRLYINWLAEKLGITKLEDWYSVTNRQLRENDGRPLLQLYNYSVARIVSEVIPDHEWHMWKFNSTPDGWWEDHQNQLKFVEWMRSQLGYSLEDCYKLTSQQISQLGGGGLLSKYSRSPMMLFMSVYKDHNWLPWKFSQLPRNYWLNRANRQAYMEWLSKQLGITSLSDWYNVSQSAFVKNYGSSLLALYDFSPTLLVMSCFPDHSWKPWKFTHVSRHFWSHHHNCLAFCEWIRLEELKFVDMEGWYEVSYKQFSELGGTSLLKSHKGSLLSVLQYVYPTHPWKPWKFPNSPRNFWSRVATSTEQNSVEAIRELIRRIETKLQITTPMQWKHISISAIPPTDRKKLRKAGGLLRALQLVYQNFEWDALPIASLGVAKKSQQRLIMDICNSLLPPPEARDRS